MPVAVSAKVGISWAITVAVGVYGFYLAKESIITKRVEHMKVRERMRLSNSGDYEPSPRKF